MTDDAFPSTAAGRLDDEYAAITELWSPRVVAGANGQYVKLGKGRGEFVWHAHPGEDEFFLIYRGELTLRYRDRPDVVLRAGDFHVVPRGVQHAPRADGEAWFMLIEPAATTHTGAVESVQTRSVDSQTAHLK